MDARNGKRGRGRPRVYDWGAWLAQRRFTLRPGINYTCRVGSVLQQLRNAASICGVRIEVETDETGTVRVRVLGRETCPK